MNRQWGIGGVALACLLWTGAATAADFTINDFVGLVQAGKTHQALQQAAPHLSDWEGDPRFDFYYGLAAINAGEVSRGVFGLERVLMVQPGNLRARLELARGYYLLNEDARARREFKLVLKRRPPAQVRANIERFLRLIRLRESRYTTTAQAYVDFSMGYDDNVNSAPGDANLYIPALGPIILNQTSTKQGDLFSTMSLGGQVTKPLRPGLSLFGSGSLSQLWHLKQNEVDTTALTVQGGVTKQYKANRYRLIGLGQQFFVAGQIYRYLGGVNAEWSRNFGRTTGLTGYLSWVDLKYPYQRLRNSDQYTIGATVKHAFAGARRPLLFANLFAGTEISDQRTSAAKAVADRGMEGGRLGGQLMLAPQVVVNGTLTLQLSRYHGVDSLYFKRRRDLYSSAELGVRWLFGPHWSADGTLSYAHNDSNISLYAYKRSQIALGARYEY